MYKTSLKRIYTRVLVLILAIIVAFGCFITGRMLLVGAEESKPFVDYPATAVSISNSQFQDTSSSGKMPYDASSWTAAGINDLKKGQAATGIVDLNKYDTQENRKSVKLDQYPEYKTAVPASPFGSSNTYPGTNKNVLLVNTTLETTTAYGYTSTEMVFAPNKYYMVSVFVKTGDFADNTGASIRLNGLGDDVSFNSINTVKNLSKKDGLPELTPENLYGFKEYKFYVATPSMKSNNVTLSLAVGTGYTDAKDATKNYTKAANGYAMFDNVNAYEISPTSYYSAISNYDKSCTLVKDYSNVVLDDNNLSFQDATLNGWKFEGNEGNFSKGIYNAGASFTSDNRYGLKSDPISALGKGFRSDYDSNILVLSSPSKAVAAGYKSNSFSIPRHTFYRVSVFVKTEDIVGGSGATVVISSDKNKDATGTDPKDKLHKTTIANADGDSTNTARYGWKEQLFYIKGSSTAERNINVELWLGQEDNESRGKAMFDNVRVEKITSTEYTDNSANGTIVNLDDFDTAPSTGITNGLFYEAGNYEEYKYPLAPASWTYYDASTAATKNYSTKTVDTENLISGLMPVDFEHFNANKENYGGGVVNPRPGTKGNVLYIASSTATAACYRSTAFTVTANTAGKLSVKMKVGNMTGSGANLVLKKEDTVIATIENIKQTDGFADFTFYVEGGLADTSTLSVEIWLGLNDRKNNETKLATGNIYVDSVSYATLAEGETFITYKQNYEKAKQNNSYITSAAYSIKTEDFNAYDYYDTSYVKYPYNWELTANKSGSDISTVTYGIFDSKRVPGDQNEVPFTFKNSKDAKNNGVLMLHNVAPTSSKLTLKNKTNIPASDYYKVSVTMKVDIPTQDSAIGAGIELFGTKYKFENIKSTATTTDSIVDNETFQTYNFYVKTAGEALDISVAITLGGSNYTSEACSGRVYVNNVEITQITNVLYDEETKDLRENSTYIVDDYNIKAEIGTTEEDNTEKEPFEIAWWLLPTILFSAALLIALVGAVVRRILDKRVKAKKYAAPDTADRHATLSKIYNENSGDENKIKEVNTNDITYSEFDDNASETANTVTKKKETEQKEVSENVTNETEKTENVETENAEPKSETTETVKEKPVVKQEVKPSTPTDGYNDTFED